MITKNYSKCPKIKITKQQLLELFDEYSKIFIDFEMIDNYYSDLPTNEWVNNDFTNIRTDIMFMMLDFYCLLGKDEFRRIIKDKIKEHLRFLDDMSYDDLMNEASILVANSLNRYQDDLDGYIDDHIKWFEFQLTRNIFEPQFELIEEVK